MVCIRYESIYEYARVLINNLVCPANKITIVTYHIQDNITLFSISKILNNCICSVFLTNFTISQ